MKTSLLGLVAGIVVPMLAGCYYYEEDYYRTGPGGDPYGARNARGRRDPRAQPRAPEPAPAWGEEAPEPPASWGEETPQPEPEPEPGPGDITEEPAPAAEADFVARLVGVAPDAKDDLERAIRAIDGMESVQVLYYKGGELGLALYYDGSVRTLKRAVDAACRNRVKRFVLEAAAESQPASNLSVRIFAPADGSRLAQSTVYVGVEVQGDGQLRITVNGIPADPLPTAGRYRAKIECRAGENEIIARVEDGQGRSARASIRLFVADDDAPPAENLPLTVVVQGKVNDPLSTVSIDGKAVKVEPDGTYRAEVALREGQKEVLVVAVDSLGNKTIRKIPVGSK